MRMLTAVFYNISIVSRTTLSQSLKLDLSMLLLSATTSLTLGSADSIEIAASS